MKIAISFSSSRETNMFEFSGRLDHLLPPSAYFDPGWFGREQSAIFASSWNLFCLRKVLAKSGDRFAGEVAGAPVVVVNDQGRLHAIRNVCGHRHSLICKEGCSRGPKLKCQIHGWEYDQQGRLTKIPDGTHFKVVKPGDFSLSTYRVEELGPFVFVNLSNDGPTVRETLGELVGDFERYFENVRLVNTWTTEHPVNWKVIIENAVESYHVPMIHPTTFRDFRDEEMHDHELAPTYTRYRDLLPYESEKSLKSAAFRYYTRLLIKNPSFARLTHVNWFPNLLMYYGDIYSGMKVVEPLGPERTRYTVYSFVPNESSLGWVGLRLMDVGIQFFLRALKRILREDMALWRPVQKGLRSSENQGVLSAREERVFAFQRYLCERLGRSPQLMGTSTDNESSFPSERDNFAKLAPTIEEDR